MKFTVLGRYGRFAPPGGATAGFLVEGGGAKVLFDCGSGVVSRLQEFIGVTELDAVFLSHLHADHCSDYGVLAQCGQYLKNVCGAEIRYSVFAPCTPADARSVLENTGLKKRFNYITEGFTVRLKQMTVTAFGMSHTAPEPYGFLIVADGKTLAYTGDTVACEGLMRLVASADYVIGDACVLQKDWNESRPHISVAELSRLCRGKKLYLTHLDDAILDETLAEAREYEPSAELVSERKTYCL